MYKDKTVPVYIHTVTEVNRNIENNNIVCLTFRNPLDSVASWYHYRHNYLTHKIKNTIEDDLKFWFRFNSNALKNKDNLTFMNFHKFSNNLIYIKNVIKNMHNIDPTHTYTVDEMKEIVIKNDDEVNLPRGNKEELDIIKKKILALPLYKKAVELFQEMESLTKEQ